MIDRILALGKRLAKPMPAVGQTPADVVHHENKWRLLHYKARPAGLTQRTPVLCVPSLINRHYVLDLMPGKSFIEWLVARGHDVYCIDWGTPSDEDRFLTFDDITDNYIGRAIRVACRTSAVPQVHLMGYCLGGTLSVIHAAVHPEQIASLSLLAAPVSFSDDGLLSQWTRTKGFDLHALVEATGNVPWQLMQSAFHMLRPTMNLAKAVGVLDRAWDDEFLDGFFAIETWGNDNVSFPGACYERYIRELYREDRLIKGTFSLSGKPALLENIRCPTQAITFEHDGIVPAASARVLLDRISSADKVPLHLSGGHVGAVVSKKAAQGLWPQMAAFWEARDAGRAATTAATLPARAPAIVSEPVAAATPVAAAPVEAALAPPPAAEPAPRETAPANGSRRAKKKPATRERVR